MKNGQIRATLLCSLFIGLLVGCSSPANESGDKPKKLTFGLLVPEGSEQTFERLQVLSQYFSQKLGMEVVQIPITESSAMLEAMRAKKIDVGSGGAFTYLVASKAFGAEAIVVAGEADGNTQYYKSVLITKGSSPLRNIDDVIKNRKNITLSWAYPTSTSGHLVPRYYLQQRGVMPDDFKEVYTSTNHAATFLSVVSGKVDVAAVLYATLDRFIATGKIKKGDIKIIWESEPIPQGPIFVRKGLAPELKKRIQQAYLDVSNDPKAMAALRSQFSYKAKYVAVADSVYQPLREMANKIKGLELVEK